MTDLEKYVELLKEKLPKHRAVKIPSLSEEDAKKVLTMLRSQGIQVDLVDKNTFRLTNAKKRQRVTIRIDDWVVNKLMEIYHEPNLSKAIRMALSEVLTARGIQVDLTKRKKEEEDIPSVDEVFNDAQ